MNKIISTSMAALLVASLATCSSGSSSSCKYKPVTYTGTGQEMDAQSADIDGVLSSTITSNGIKYVVNEALKQAQGTSD